MNQEPISIPAEPFVELLKKERQADAIRHQSWMEYDNAKRQRMSALNTETPAKVMELYIAEKEAEKVFDKRVREHRSSLERIDRAIEDLEEQLLQGAQ